MKGQTNRYNTFIQNDKFNLTESEPSQSNYYHILSDLNSYANIQEFSDSIQAQSNHSDRIFHDNLFNQPLNYEKDSQFQLDLFQRPIYPIPQTKDVRTIENRSKDRDKFWDMLRNYQEQETQIKVSQSDFHEKQTFTFKRQTASSKKLPSFSKKQQIIPVIKEQKEEIQQNNDQNQLQVIKYQKAPFIKAINPKNPFMKRKKYQYRPTKKQIKKMIQDQLPNNLGKKGYSQTLEFVQFGQVQQDQSRKYPKRASRMPPLRPYFCERVDYSQNGYWIQKGV